MALSITLEKKAAIFKSLAEETIYKVGLQYGFDKHYKTTSGVKGRVYNIYKEVKNDPQKFGVQLETAAMVEKIVSSRSITTIPQVSLREKDEELSKIDAKQLLFTTRDDLLRVINKKVGIISKSVKKLDSTTLSELSKAYQILFDKSQITRGEATEHVAFLAKNINDKMSPTEAMKVMLDFREEVNISKEKK